MKTTQLLNYVWKYLNLQKLLNPSQGIERSQLEKIDTRLRWEFFGRRIYYGLYFMQFTDQK